MKMLYSQGKAYFLLDILAVYIASITSENTKVSGNIMTGPLKKITVLKGNDVNLPCDSKPSVANDSLILVIWYRDDDPVYSYDSRLPELTAQWTADTLLNRVKWFSHPNSSLRIRNVQLQDKATYSCRVEFQASSTHNDTVELDVVELPGRPIIFDEYGNEVVNAGPYNEGDDFKFICSVKGGMPPPTITWLYKDTQIGLASLTAGGSPSINTRSLTLSIKNATRDHQSSLYTCVANNTILSPPQRTSVRLNLFCLHIVTGEQNGEQYVSAHENLLKPLTVNILPNEQAMSEGTKNEFRCTSRGSHPPAVLTWWIKGEMLYSKERYRDDLEETQSLLQWAPSKKHNGAILTCRAENPKINNSAIESELLLNIYYKPTAKILFGDMIDPNDIREGDKVNFKCIIDANPAVDNVIWEHNGDVLEQYPITGVMLTGITKLVIHNLLWSHTGNYSCTASNILGDGKSQALFMQVIYKPICRFENVKQIGTALKKPLTILCDADAFPPPSSFEWYFNNSAGFKRIKYSNRYTINDKIQSVLNYTPVTEVHYGTLTCRAENSAGKQSRPCVYELVPSAKPDPPTNCTVNYWANDCYEVYCIAGHDGGLHCKYTMEVWSDEESSPIEATTNNEPFWKLKPIVGHRQLKLIVYAANKEGKSDEVMFFVDTGLVKNWTVKEAHKSNYQQLWNTHWAMGSTFVAVLIVVIVPCIAFIVMRLRRKTQDYEVSNKMKTKRAKIMEQHLAYTRTEDRTLEMNFKSEDTFLPNNEKNEYIKLVFEKNLLFNACELLRAYFLTGPKLIA